MDTTYLQLLVVCKDSARELGEHVSWATDAAGPELDQDIYSDVITDIPESIDTNALLRPLDSQTRRHVLDRCRE